ncbi:hypothetical protein F4779DRAFT_429824 [Xylariaceae sp. FL0662B]|nr:hypothetical protein F4779DRAFT_429824 [Xylariaceae sp. FL0662B]
MRFTGAPVLATLALTATYLPGILAGRTLGGGSQLAILERRVANSNYTAVANGTDAADVGQDEENADEENADEENVDEENNADEEQNADDQNADDQNNDENVDEEYLKNVEDEAGIDIDENDVQGSLEQNILELMLSMGVCNFDIASIAGIGIGSQVQLLLQLQQLAQLQQLGIVNAVSIGQLVQQEILLNNFNLNIIKRTVDASVKQAARGKKRAVMKRECKNAGNQ